MGLVITGRTVFEWDELVEFKKRLGIEIDIFDLNIQLEYGFCAMITYTDKVWSKEGVLCNVTKQVCDHTISESIFEWPEFVKLAERIGVDMSKHTTSLEIDLDVDNIVNVQHNYMATSTSA